MWVRQGKVLRLVRMQFLQTASSMNVQFGYGLASAVLNVNDNVLDKNINEYPNPTKEIVNLSVHSDWVLYNMPGQILETGSGNTISMIHFNKGVYWVAIGNEKYKIIKQ